MGDVSSRARSSRSRDRVDFSSADSRSRAVGVCPALGYTYAGAFEAVDGSSRARSRRSVSLR
jgi:hypothetical protein